MNEIKEIIMVERPKLYDFLYDLDLFFNIYPYSHGRHSYILAVVKEINKKKRVFHKTIMFINKGNISNYSMKAIRNL